MSSERYAVIGDPVAHSLSPILQRAAFQGAGIEAQYDAVAVAAASLPSLVRRFRLDGVQGFNVTMPHKQTIIHHLDEVVEPATVLDAVNTVVRRGDRFIGHNTDVTGFDGALSMLAGARWSGCAVVFGAGGAARAVVLALATRGSQVCVAARRVDRARQSMESIDTAIRIESIGSSSLRCLLSSTDLAVNATPLGMAEMPHETPLGESTFLRPGSMAMDLVYGRDTPFLRQARMAGCTACDGTEMLLRQGAAAFQLWTGIEPDMQRMRAALHAHLEEVRRVPISDRG
jgi:shikimate dehydrogenase